MSVNRRKIRAKADYRGRDRAEFDNFRSPFTGIFKQISTKLFVIVVVTTILLSGGYYFFRSTTLFSGGFEVSGNTITVLEGGDLQGALDAARPGDTIFLEAGATFTGNFDLPRKDGAEFITVRSSAPDSEIPPAGVRIDPILYERILPKIVSAKEYPVLTAFDGAHHFRFVAVEFGGTKNGIGNIIKIGTTEEATIGQLPSYLEFDRVFIHGTSPKGQRRGIAANGKHIKVINSHISDIKIVGDESSAIGIWATDGPVEIANNYLEAAGINILFGGGISRLKLVPTDCIVRDNHLNKRPEWKDAEWEVKNLFEIKNGRRIAVENNLMTNNWAMGQDGTAILFSTRADNGDATVIDDITFTGNIIRDSDNGISVFGGEGSGGHDLKIRNNVFDRISGFFMRTNDWDGLLIEGNTIINSGDISKADIEPIRGFIFRNNIIAEGEFGFKGNSTASGTETIDKWFSGGDVSGNVIVGGQPSRYRGKNDFVRSFKEIFFQDAAAGDHRLSPQDPFYNKQIGADLDPKTVGRALR